MKTNYSVTTEIDVLEEPQLDFKYYVNPVQKRSSVKPKKNETLNVLSLFSGCYSKAKYTREVLTEFRDSNSIYHAFKPQLN